MKRILTYGTFDLLHWGHIRLLKRAKELGDYLVVGLSTDEFNEAKPGKQPSYHPYEVRKMMLESIRYVDLVIPEQTWEQKRLDVTVNEIDMVVMGSDWEGSPRFEYLRSHCDVAYLPRTEGTSTSEIRRDLLFEAIEYVREDEEQASQSQSRPASESPSPPPPGTARLRSLGTDPETRLPRPPRRD
ncbi:glycerol-3-phosphate cytidylyltransferase [Nesterenkonia salmonea]|uniref:Glycerol-3-phosphate cytidylyltransferase n=1 Tax=Nesterenkonia salmonea TaxID=1804987 RepID=A0A5R9B9W1_9MICC|nr:glycerol-3-phosphate cytidylyltransferase [Nesterenkonia salmonea]